MEPQPRLSPNQFKGLYKNPMITNVRLFRRGKQPHQPITYAEIIDVTEDITLYWFDPGFRVWHLVGYTP